MSRPRTPSNILQLRGSFAAHPERKRSDPPGGAPFNERPPEHLPRDAVPAWNWIVARLPRVAVYNTDEIAVEVAACLLSRWWAGGQLDTLKELRFWLGKLGFSPQDRTHLAEAPKAPRANPFLRNGRPPKEEIPA
jgi:hypothetical protein